MLVTLAVTFNLNAKVIKASFAKMPGYAESVDKGILIDFVKAIEEVLGVKIERTVVPFARSVNNAVEGEADFHLPLIKLPESKSKSLPYDYSTETIFHVNFVLYTNKSKNISTGNLKGKNLETDRAHINYFEFPIKPSAGIENSLKKVNAGRIDGFIFADFATDPVLKKLNLKNIKRQLFKRYDVKMVLKKGGRGGEVDKLLSEAIAKLKKSGEFDKIMSVLEKPYDNWQL
jgi:polar amino acid transport system substrate-binding protein